MRDELIFIFFSLVDLGEENDRNLKMPSEIAADKAASGTEVVETAEMTTVQIAEQAGEKPVKVSKITETREGERTRRYNSTEKYN